MYKDNLYKVIGLSGYNRLIWAATPKEALETFKRDRHELEYDVYEIDLNPDGQTSFAVEILVLKGAGYK